MMIAEIAQTPRKVHETNWKEHSHIVNQELFVRTLLSGRPLVLISGHFGNFELGGYLMGLFGFPTYTVARALDNPYLDRFVNDFRGRTGQYMLPKKGSGADIQSVLERGGILTLLGDQAAGQRQCWVNFFGKPASTHKAVSVFSLGNDAPTMVSYARRVGKPLHYEVGPAAICDPRDPDFELRHASRSSPSGTPTIWKNSSAIAGPILVAPPPLEGRARRPQEAATSKRREVA